MEKSATPEKAADARGGMFSPVRRHWKLTLLAYLAFAGAVAGILWSLPNVYTSYALFFPVEQEEEAGAASLLSLAKAKTGLSIGGSPLNQVLLFKEILGTFAFADRFARVLDDAERRQMFKKDPDTSLIKGKAQMVTWCRKNITMTSNAMTGIITLSVSSWKQEASQSLVGKIVGILNELSATMNEERLRKQRDFLQGSRERVKGDLNRKDMQVVELERRNMGVYSPDIMNQKVKLLREQKILEETYVLLEGQLLDVEIKLSRNSQTLRYIERPTYALVKDKPKRKLILGACLAGFAALHVAGLLLLGNLGSFSLRR